MKRFFGMMPSSEVEREERFNVGLSQIAVTVEAGKNGWTIFYEDGSSNHEDIIDTTNNNFDRALGVLKTKFDEINKI